MLGIGALVVYILCVTPPSESLTQAIVISASIYFVFSTAAGILISNSDWKTGLWVASPIFFVVILSVAFTGIFSIKNLTHDLPMTIVVILSSTLGRLIGSWFGTKGHVKYVLGVFSFSGSLLGFLVV